MSIHYATLEIKEADGIHTITLNRPDRRNALNPQMIAELTHALGESSTCSCGVVVLTGAGTAFCSGMDLENLKSLTDERPEDQRADAESTMWMMRRLYELNKPTIAAVNGPAIAGGHRTWRLYATLPSPRHRPGSVTRRLESVSSPP